MVKKGDEGRAGEGRANDELHKKHVLYSKNDLVGIYDSKQHPYRTSFFGISSDDLINH